MDNGTSIVTGENRGYRTFNFYMDKLCGGKVTISIQWDHRKAMSKENSSSPVNGSWNVKIPSLRRNTHTAKQQDYPTRMHDGLRIGGTTLASTRVTKEKIKVAIHPEYPERTFAIGSTLIEEGRKALCGLLRRNLDVFA
ncbi:hypothetical protein Tco_1091656 [Tanacetum coccineum]|uniref:Uncharacterized protein n=1 Tax=Tanacetum coccineum TaxID=301880 RepID=A0ABQ5I7P3_9ASTR